MEKRRIGRRSDGLQGEGNYGAAREYNERTKRFVRSGQVEPAARKAKPKTDEEAAELDRAEEIGKRPAKK